MDWLIGYAARHDLTSEERKNAVNYSYVLGQAPAAARYQPHVHSQQAEADSDLLILSELIKGRPPVNQAG